MKIKLFITTYNNSNRINTTIKQLENCKSLDKLEINIINNHSSFLLNNTNLKINVINNNTRPDFSTGHLSRTWNQCIMLGFKSLTNPDCDLLVTAQDDTYFHENWIKRVIKLSKIFEFIQNGHGDHICVYKPEHIIKTGMWDERFCGISRQAADYFYRSLMYNKDNISINDVGHKRIWNPIFKNNYIKSQNYLVNSNSRKIFKDEVYDNTTDNNDQISLKLLVEKYGLDPYPWNESLFLNLPKRTQTKNYITYPYFEKDIVNLKEKNYLI